MKPEADRRTVESARLLSLLGDLSGEEEAVGRLRAEAEDFDAGARTAELEALLKALGEG